MKKILIAILICLACLVLLAVIAFVILFFLTRNIVMDGPGMENTNTGEDAMDFSDYEGTWYNRDKSVKLVVEKGRVTGYRLENGHYKLNFMRRARMDAYGALESADSNHADFADYRELVKRGNLLYGPSVIFMTDVSQEPDEEFAREGYEEDFAPLPVYVKRAYEVADRSLESFSMSAERRGGEEPFVFASLPGCEGAKNISFFIDRHRSGEKYVSVNVNDESDGELIEKEYPLSPELEEALADLLLTPEVLAKNPYVERDQMIAPTVQFVLDARFGSGELISIHSSYGVLIGDKKAAEIAELFLNGK